MRTSIESGRGSAGATVTLFESISCQSAAYDEIGDQRARMEFYEQLEQYGKDRS
jgi:hypothetical protein